MGRRYDPTKHNRKSLRLKGWDYTSLGAYFITICTHQKQMLFDEPLFREIAEYAWRNIPNQPHAKHVILDEWVMMPNHLHGIIVLSEMEGGSPVKKPARNVLPRSVPSIVGNYKSLVTRQINKVRRSPGSKIWQRGYYERIIRNEREMNAIRRYIRANPARWEEDRENLNVIVARMKRVGPPDAWPLRNGHPEEAEPT